MHTVIDDIDEVNAAGRLSRRPYRKVQKTISADIRPGAGSAAQVMLAMRLRAQLDALRTLSNSFDSIERALRAMRIDRRILGLTCVHRRFLAVAHAGAVSEVVLDLVALQAMVAQLHSSVMDLPFLEVMKDTEVAAGDLDEAAQYLRATASASFEDADSRAEKTTPAAAVDLPFAAAGAPAVESAIAASIANVTGPASPIASRLTLAHGNAPKHSSRFAADLSADLPLAVRAKAEDFAADRFRKSWPELLFAPLTILRQDAGWADEAYLDWLQTLRLL